MSPAEARSIVWNEDSEDIEFLDPGEHSDRLFTFEVAKTNEQEENVTVRAGFRVRTDVGNES